MSTADTQTQPKAPPLYELTTYALQISDALDVIEEAGLDSEAAQTLFDAHFKNLEDIEGKLEAYCRVIRTEAALAKMRREEADYMDSRAKAAESRVEYLKESITMALEVLGTEKMSAGPFTVGFQNNGGVLGLEVSPLPDNAPYPPQFLKEPEVDDSKVRAALEAGTELGWARFRPRGRHLRIR